ncbi:hypothetical protein [Pedobacter foliorum]|uniref:hypothetical protein n=1 Tax=Pedobacter foliorum TaxID=2739058 RepID=UPI001567B81A|nr:hypothetical protein [Pedobacter foliorum]NRF37477.1 hypothetical protein [Pedobacter foliorum]
MSAAQVNRERINPESGFFQFLAKTSDLAIIIDHKPTILYKNPKAAERIIGNKLQTVISEDHKNKFALVLNKMIVKNEEACKNRFFLRMGYGMNVNSLICSKMQK